MYCHSDIVHTSPCVLTSSNCAIDYYSKPWTTRGLSAVSKYSIHVLLLRFSYLHQGKEILSWQIQSVRSVQSNYWIWKSPHGECSKYPGSTFHTCMKLEPPVLRTAAKVYLSSFVNKIEINPANKVCSQSGGIYSSI